MIIKLKRPTRSLKLAYYYLYPKRITLPHNPPIYAWLWWNFSFRQKQTEPNWDEEPDWNAEPDPTLRKALRDIYTQSKKS